MKKNGIIVTLVGAWWLVVFAGSSGAQSQARVDLKLTFRTLLRSSEAILEAPLHERGRRALHSLLHAASLFVSRRVSCSSPLPINCETPLRPSGVRHQDAAFPPDERPMPIQPRLANVRRLWLLWPLSPWRARTNS